MQWNIDLLTSVSAVWMLPLNYDYGGWPASGEMDIMESRGNLVNNRICFSDSLKMIKFNFFCRIMIATMTGLWKDTKYS